MAIGTTAAIMLAIGAAGAATSATTSIRAGNAARRVGEQNAQLGELQAQDALARGADDERRYRGEVRQVIGAQRAGLAASGVDIDSGSALDVQADASHLGELDALTIRQNAQREAWGLRRGAQDIRQRGQIAQSEGRNQALGTLVGTGYSLLGSRYGFGAK